MQINVLPHQDLSDRPTGCCARFDPEGWNGLVLRFREKPFLRAETRSAMYMPLDMARVFARVLGRIEASCGFDPDDTLVLSHDLSPWRAEHFFAVKGDVEGEEMTTMTGDFITKVFEGPYRQVGSWRTEMEALVRDRGKVPGRIYFYYTTCPACAKAMGRNYVVGLAEI
jgi:hypothetical protein